MVSEDPYEVILAPSVKHALAETLPTSAAFAAYEFIFGPLAENSQRLGSQLRAPFEGLYRARRGEYRVRYEIDDERHLIIVLDVDHRRDAYNS